MSILLRLRGKRAERVPTLPWPEERIGRTGGVLSWLAVWRASILVYRGRFLPVQSFLGVGPSSHLILPPEEGGPLLPVMVYYRIGISLNRMTDACENITFPPTTYVVGKKVSKVVLYNFDVTAMCSVTKCKQSSFIDH